jgi:hypothetical protein
VGGDLAAAYDTLAAPALSQRPTDVGGLSALARMFNAAGDNERALAPAQAAGAAQPQRDVNVLWRGRYGHAGARQQLRTGLLDQVSKLDSSDPATLTEAACIYRAMGRVGWPFLLRQGGGHRGAASAGRAMASISTSTFRTQRRLPGNENVAAIPPPADQARPAVMNAAPH